MAFDPKVMDACIQALCDKNGGLLQRALEVAQLCGGMAAMEESMENHDGAAQWATLAAHMTAVGRLNRDMMLKHIKQAESAIVVAPANTKIQLPGGNRQ